MVMADHAMQALEEGAQEWNAVRKRLQHSPGLAKDKGTSSQCFYCVLKRNHKPPKTMARLLQHQFCVPYAGFAGRVPEGSQQVPTVTCSGLGYGECCTAQVRQIFFIFGIKMFMF